MTDPAKSLSVDEELLAALKDVSWHSACKDNMEFEARITYVQMDAIRAAISKAEASRDHGSSPVGDTHRDADRAVVGDYPHWLNGTPEWPVGTPEWCSLATDKIEGLTADLRSAVLTAYRRGAKEWARLNYPQWVGWLESCPPLDDRTGGDEPEASAQSPATETAVVGETWSSIATWCEETFGPVTLERTARRADEEMKELLANPDDVMEAADVCIVLSRYPGLADAIDRKMKINRARTWNLKGDGTGYHVKGAQP